MGKEIIFLILLVTLASLTTLFFGSIEVGTFPFLLGRHSTT
jgi:hypothetical protein